MSSEIRTTTAKLIMRFDFSLAEGEDGERLLTQAMDHFTIAPGSLDIVFKLRTESLSADTRKASALDYHMSVGRHGLPR